MVKEKKDSVNAEPNCTFLVVMEPFNDYSRGDRIDDPELIKAVLSSPQSQFVVPHSLEKK